MSLPSWECGLKYKVNFFNYDLPYVAPFVGVWIEIVKYNLNLKDVTPSLPSWECGLKFHLLPLTRAEPSRSLRGSVD